MQLIDCQLRVEQARAVLNMWLEACSSVDADQLEQTMVCTIITLLDGVPEALRDISSPLNTREGK